MIGVGIIGIGAIGRLHFDCWKKSPQARVVAIASRDARKRAGDWAGGEFNLGAQAEAQVDLSGIAAYAEAAELLADPQVQIVDICSATPLHAPLAIAALRAGKHVVCEKPMALTAAECAAVEAAARESGGQLMVAHCLRYWPHYVKAQELLVGGELGRPLYAQLHRSGGVPAWSAGGWLMQPEESGGVLDLHIHDIDVALWWFGEPAQMETTGYSRDGLPLIMDSTWRYPGGLCVQLHGAWDPNGGMFRHAFRLVLEKGTLVYDLATAPDSLQLFQNGTATEVPLEKADAHQAELDDFAAAIAEGKAFARFTPAESRRAVEAGLREWQQLREMELGRPF